MDTSARALTWAKKIFSNYKTDLQRQTQAELPLTLIPIRIDIDIPSYVPPPALPLPPDHHNSGVNAANPAYRSSDATPSYRVKDYFLWNLHEALITPEQFAVNLLNEADIPLSHATEMSTQIRKQLEEYAGVALHPAFHPATKKDRKKAHQPAVSRDHSSTPRLTPLVSGVDGTSSPSKGATATNGTPVISCSATATTVPQPQDSRLPYDADDAYRCIVNLNINLQNQLYTDKFEWSMTHPPGMAEMFAKQTCADLGLSGEWVPAIAHGIYESVLKSKKEVIESGGLSGSLNGFGGDLDNMAMNEAGAGLRFDPDNLCAEWEPKVETLSKEEIEKKEGDRERQLRRLRRETARFSSTTNVAGGMMDQKNAEEEPQALGRGERAKKKRRFRSLSPQGRGTPEVGSAGYGGLGVGSLHDWFAIARYKYLRINSDVILYRERPAWYCSNCRLPGSAAWGVRDGPRGPRVSLNVFSYIIILSSLHQALRDYKTLMGNTEPLPELRPHLRA